MPLLINVTGDFICPWCFIGERRLAAALARLPEGVSYEVAWHPFELNPEMPDEGMDRRAYRSRKFGSWERSLQLDQHTVDAGLADGIAFNYDAMAITPNTFAAHRATAFAARFGRQYNFVSAVLRGYFREGRDIGSVDVLSDIASEIGIDRNTTHRFLLSGEGADNVRAEERAATRAGIRGVPLFEIGTVIISGAQSIDALEGVILSEADAAAA